MTPYIQAWLADCKIVDDQHQWETISTLMRPVLTRLLSSARIKRNIGMGRMLVSLCQTWHAHHLKAVCCTWRNKPNAFVFTWAKNRLEWLCIMTLHLMTLCRQIAQKMKIRRLPSSCVKMLTVIPAKLSEGESMSDELSCKLQPWHWLSLHLWLIICKSAVNVRR